MYKSRKCQQLQRPNGTKIFLKLQQNYTAAISRDFLVTFLCFSISKSSRIAMRLQNGLGPMVQRKCKSVLS